MSYLSTTFQEKNGGCQTALSPRQSKSTKLNHTVLVSPNKLHYKSNPSQAARRATQASRVATPAVSWVTYRPSWVPFCWASWSVVQQTRQRLVTMVTPRPGSSLRTWSWEIQRPRVRSSDLLFWNSLLSIILTSCHCLIYLSSLTVQVTICYLLLLLTH